MNNYFLEIFQGGEGRRVKAEEEKSLLAHIRAAGFSLAADCGGVGRCGKCTAEVSGRVKDSRGDILALENRSLLSCRFYPAGPCTVTLPAAESLRVVTGGLEQIPPGGEGLGAAVDIGTTTVAMMLYDLATGKLLQSLGARSAQRPYGADVISRIQACSEAGGLDRLQGLIARQIEQGLEELCRRAGRPLSGIRQVCIAGNTVMEHIFTHLDPQSIGVAPFRPLSLFGRSFWAEDLLPALPPETPVYLCPAVAGYVGGDITAGLLAADADKAEELTLFLDVGTNGEMALGDKNGWLCCAAAAGPAFEGAEIACGMGGEPGAIDKVWLEDGEIRFHVIGSGAPRGLCGSGLLDAVAALLQADLILPSGRMEDEDAHPNLRRADGEMRYFFTDEVWLSAADIRAVQLAKAALRAGIETLLELKGLQANDISQCLLAGGFGAYMSVASACAIGLLPPVLEKKTRHLGNAAGMGAALALDRQERARLEDLQTRCQYHELSGSAVFNDCYLEAMPFDE